MKKNRINKTNKLEFLFDAKGNKVGVLLATHAYEKLMNMVDDYHDYKMATKLRKKPFTKK